MPESTYQSDITSAPMSGTISDSHFGANCVATANFALNGSPFESAIQSLGITHLRYPGGTVTEERIDPNSHQWSEMINSEEDYVQLSDGARVQTLHSLLDYAAEHEIHVTFVLPTVQLLTEGPAGSREPNYDAIDRMIDQFSNALRENPDSSRITAIEIGNEYYYQGRMTAEEYGTLANYMITELSAALQAIEGDISAQTGFTAPSIAIQSGAGWQPGDNETIIGLLDPTAKAAVDAVVIHYYPRTLESVGNFDRALNELDDWRADPDFQDLQFFASEWNIQNSDASDNGMFHAGSLVAAFEELILEGIDMASVWGTQYRAMDTRLSTLSSRDSGDDRATQIDTDLTAAGEVFSIMSQSLPGLRPVEIDSSAYVGFEYTLDSEDQFTTNIAITDFGSEDRYIAFISNRDAVEAQQARFDLESYFGPDAHASLRILTPIDDPSTLTVDESNPTAHNAETDLDFEYSGPAIDFPPDVQIPPGAILVLEVTLNSDGVVLEGQNPISDEAFIDYDDRIVGSTGDDTVLGHSGNDEIRGEDGNDLLSGGSANDLVVGGDGHDALLGGSGQDTLIGGFGTDFIVDGAGRDQTFGGLGNDVFIDGEGNDEHEGAQGNDLFLLSSGSDTVEGGLGADTIVAGEDSSFTFSDFDIENGDAVDLSAFFDEADDLRSALETAVRDYDSDGMLRIQTSDSTFAEVSYDGSSVDELLNGFLISGQSGTPACLASSLNRLTFDQVAGVTASMPAGTLSEMILGQSADVLFQELEPNTAAAILIGLSPNEISELSEILGSDSYLGIVSSLSDEQLMQFFSTASPAQLDAILEHASSPDLVSWYSTLPGMVQEIVFERLDGTLLPRPLREDFEDWDEDDDDIDLEIGEEDDDDPIIPINESPDVPPGDDEDGDNGSDSAEVVSGDCFVATVAFANPQHPAVWMLRWYRDTILRKSNWGRIAVGIYWLFGPILARSVSNSPRVRWVLRVMLLFVAHFVAWLYSRDLGRQVDHIFWPENRSASFRVWSGRRYRKWK